eukprot:159-Rhodomonas_salina.1
MSKRASGGKRSYEAGFEDAVVERDVGADREVVRAACMGGGMDVSGVEQSSGVALAEISWMLASSRRSAASCTALNTASCTGNGV